MFVTLPLPAPNRDFHLDLDKFMHNTETANDLRCIHIMYLVVIKSSISFHRSSDVDETR